MFYVGCHKPTTTLLFYLDLVQATNDDLIIQCQDMNRNYMRRISESKVKEALKRMKSRKAIGPDGIPIEV